MGAGSASDNEIEALAKTVSIGDGASESDSAGEVMFEDVEDVDD